MPPPRRNSKPVSSGRYLALRHRRDRLNALRGIRLTTDSDKSPLQRGEQRLHSSYVPGLRAGSYTVEVEQTVLATTESSKTFDKQIQRFEVVAPRFALPSDCIYSTFPANGTSAPVTCLPHVVLNDAILPWERVADDRPAALPARDEDLPNRVPWLVCLTFEVDELRLGQEQLNGPQSLFPSLPNPDTQRTQSPTGEVDLDLKELLQLNPSHATTPVTQIRDATETKASVIAIPGRLFNSLVTAYDSEGVPHPDQKFCDTSRYRLLAHVREIHTEGMAHAGAEDEAIDRRFGIVVSHRTGPARRKTPTMLVSHLLSIERVSAMPFPVDENKRVVLPSLFSWTHMCVPPEMMDIPGSMDHLAEGSAMLRPSLPDSVKTSVSDPAVAEEMLRRLKDGYSLVRWRTQTGEETAAFTRGPLVPAAVKATLENTLSNAGQSLQILDKKLGLMDLSYATAWNLGRTLAMADPTFTAALCRVRKIVLQRGSDKAKIQVMRATGMPFQTKRELVASLQSLTERLADMSTVADLSRENRWRRPGSSVLPVHALDSTLVAAVYQDELDRAAYQVASGYTDRPTTEEDGVMPAPYDELNIPHSADWVVVLQFALNLRFLIPVPFHYLVSDMAALPQESLRFFHIDKNWSHALLDGALSLGNHVDRDCDRVRDAMHKAIQRYHQKPHAELDDVPLVPEYGFLLRSTLVTQFLDLKVTVESPTGAPTSCVLIRQEVVGPGIMLGLLSQVPDSNYRLTFTQPAHQQCFSIGKSLDADQVIIPFKKIYSEEGHDSDVDRGEPLDSFSWRRTKQEPHAAPMHKPGTGAVYLWETEKDADDTRILLLDNLARSVYALLKDKLGFGEEKPTAAMMAIQLNDPCWQLKIDPPLPATIFAPTNLNSLSSAPLDIDLWQPRVQLLPTRPFRATNARRAPPSRYLTAAAGQSGRGGLLCASDISGRVFHIEAF